MNTTLKANTSEKGSAELFNVKVPEDVREAAIKVANWFGMNGFGPWEYLQVCSRDHARDLREIADSPDGLDSVRLTWLSENFRDIRYINGVTMCGKYPCYSVRTREGRTERKTLREAIDAAMDTEP